MTRPKEGSWSNLTSPLTRVQKVAGVVLYTSKGDRSLLSTVAVSKGQPFAYAVPPSAPSPVPLSEAQTNLLVSIPSAYFIDVSRLLSPGSCEKADLQHLVTNRLVIHLPAHPPQAVDLDGSHLNKTPNGWHPTAFALHLASRWTGRDVRAGLPPGTTLEQAIGAADVRFSSTFAEQGPPPPHFFYREEAIDVVSLPEQQPCGALWEILSRRRTTRKFVRDGKFTLNKLSSLLRQVWGCTGTVAVTDGLVTLRKTSPSGGGMHPCEVFPIVRSVEGVVPGLYHYQVEDHALALLKTLHDNEVHKLLSEVLAGQDYFSDANVVFALAVRFDRVHWKYPDHERAYLVAAMDLGHLSQTLYLAGTEAGLGVFVTAAINSADVDAELGLDGASIAVLAMAGCGIRDSGSTPLHPRLRTSRYVRREKT